MRTWLPAVCDCDRLQEQVSWFSSSIWVIEHCYSSHFHSASWNATRHAIIQQDYSCWYRESTSCFRHGAGLCWHWGTSSTATFRKKNRSRILEQYWRKSSRHVLSPQAQYFVETSVSWIHCFKIVCMPVSVRLWIAGLQFLDGPQVKGFVFMWHVQLEVNPVYHLLGNHCLALPRTTLVNELGMPFRYYCAPICLHWKLVRPPPNWIDTTSCQTTFYKEKMMRWIQLDTSICIHIDLHCAMPMSAWDIFLNHNSSSFCFLLLTHNRPHLGRLFWTPWIWVYDGKKDLWIARWA